MIEDFLEYFEEAWEEDCNLAACHHFGIMLNMGVVYTMEMSRMYLY